MKRRVRVDISKWVCFENRVRLILPAKLSKAGKCMFTCQISSVRADARSHCEVRWTEFSERSKNGRISEPKPDITYGFPIIKPSDEAYQTLQGDPNVDNFSLPTLGNLRSGADTKLVSTPGKALLRWATKKQKSLKAMHLMCFPWAIVEVKHGTPNSCKKNERESKDHDTRTESCYCQAANASAAALILQEDLAKKAKTEFEPEDAQVVFAYTCVGSTAKLWITYRKGPVRFQP